MTLYIHCVGRRKEKKARGAAHQFVSQTSRVGTKPRPWIVTIVPAEPTDGVTLEITGVSSSINSNVLPGGTTPPTASSSPNALDEPLKARWSPNVPSSSYLSSQSTQSPPWYATFQMR